MCLGCLVAPPPPPPKKNVPKKNFVQLQKISQWELTFLFRFPFRFPNDHIVFAWDEWEEPPTWVKTSSPPYFYDIQFLTIFNIKLGAPTPTSDPCLNVLLVMTIKCYKV